MHKRNRLVIFGYASSVHTERWAKGLSGRGYDVRVVSLGGEPIDTIDTIIIPRKSAYDYLFKKKRAREAALQFKPDIIHVHYAGGYGIWGCACGHQPMVVSVWGSDIEKLGKNIFQQGYVKQTLKKADWITATSKYLLEQTKALDKNTFSKMSVVPFGVNIPETITSIDDDSVLKICYIKGHKPIYGPDIMLKAVARVVGEDPRLRLSIAGSGSYTDELKRLARQLKISEFCTFTGYIPNERIPQFIMQHDLTLMPSRAESFGVAVLDAAAAGRPTIASKVGGIPEVMRDRETGILVPPDDIHALAVAIRQLMNNRNQIQEMGQAAYEFVKKNYQWKQSLDMMEEIYEQLLQV